MYLYVPICTNMYLYVLKEIEEEMNIGERIKLLRKEKGMTQKELATAIHKSEITVRKYEANDVAITVDVFLDILEALDSKMLIESNDYCDNLLREYIDSINVDITEELYNRLEDFIYHSIIVLSSMHDLDKANDSYNQITGRINRHKK